MENLLIVNADDFGLSKGQNYGIIEACRRGVVTSTTALVNGEAVEHAAQLSREVPELGVGMHFVLTLGMPLSPMPGLTRDGHWANGFGNRRSRALCRSKRLPASWSVSSNRFIDAFGKAPTHIDSHHHVHMIPAIFPIVAEFAQRKGVAMRVDREAHGVPDCAVTTTEGFSSAFYGDEIDEALFLKGWMIPPRGGNDRWRSWRILLLSITPYVRAPTAGRAWRSWTC